jgi:hypothetical protein
MKLFVMQFLQPPVTSSLIGPNILLSTPVCVPPMMSETEFDIHTELQVKLDDVHAEPMCSCADGTSTKSFEHDMALGSTF